ncbi:MAG TPA: class F sortase [Methylomirabilota bacterium]|nr:class F sortase [Methylomirabilota bacterium]
MNGPRDEGLLARLRANETLRRLSRNRPDLLIFGAPLLAIAVIAALVVGVVAASGGGSNDSVVAGTATAEPTTAIPTPTPGENAGLKTPIAISPGSELTLADLAARGAGEPGRGEFTGQRLVIPKVNIDAPLTYKVVGGDGRMPNPNGPTDVAYYDFGQWPGLGGLPGKGGNVVLAGHVDYINYGPAVFWDLHTLAAGDRVQIVMADGSVIEYEIIFNKQIEVGDADWTAIVAATSPESVTLITCGGEFEAGHYTNRQIVWGRRV